MAGPEIQPGRRLVLRVERDLEARTRSRGEVLEAFGDQHPRQAATLVGVRDPRGEARSGYSPITDQMKPIMMKKPVNIAISPSPPYGELAPSCGTSWSPIPKTTAQPTNRKPKTNFVGRAGHEPAESRRALGRHRGPEHDHQHQRR